MSDCIKTRFVHYPIDYHQAMERLEQLGQQREPREENLLTNVPANRSETSRAGSGVAQPAPTSSRAAVGVDRAGRKNATPGADQQ
ncbi:MAG: hypothetical protein F6K65_11075, partial [Moorea sp. SIO3C2]|nr:hypothetical protein [Moorena sp. SIO3C2]